MNGSQRLVVQGFLVSMHFTSFPTHLPSMHLLLEMHLLPSSQLMPLARSLATHLATPAHGTTGRETWSGQWGCQAMSSGLRKMSLTFTLFHHHKAQACGQLIVGQLGCGHVPESQEVECAATQTPICALQDQQAQAGDNKNH